MKRGGELYYAPVQALRDPGWSLRPTYAVNPLHRQIQMKQLSRGTRYEIWAFIHIQRHRLSFPRNLIRDLMIDECEHTNAFKVFRVQAPQRLLVLYTCSRKAMSVPVPGYLVQYLVYHYSYMIVPYLGSYASIYTRYLYRYQVPVPVPEPIITW